ncbi:hypothetical protein [Pseudoalteromonas sp. ND6B]|uniref:hypothetical protein n=1 Tax=Pseudoalteromonas sp. ND6B TaxID=1535421 RepID=UPI00051D9B3C|nr:hypothetical protein [Pseudoalteromonas sp. ND6B]KGJ99478.1 hypothetical protein ND6B_2766 [Pseudoalteromonas sp. ND6B]
MTISTEHNTDKQLTEVENILAFLTDIGINHRYETLNEKTFLPGLKLEKGVLLLDFVNGFYPGDILHEAGHIAVCEPIFRPLLDADFYKNGLLAGREKQTMHAEEMAATAWAVAAATHLSLPLSIIFHDDSYKGANNSLKHAFENGKGFGFPLLQAWQMTCPNKGYPVMVKWIRDCRWIETLPNI